EPAGSCGGPYALRRGPYVLRSPSPAGSAAAYSFPSSDCTAVQQDGPAPGTGRAAIGRVARNIGAPRASSTATLTTGRGPRPPAKNSRNIPSSLTQVTRDWAVAGTQASASSMVKL